MPEEYLLRIEDVDVHYGDFLAVQNVSMKFQKGLITAVIGANGAGKSTLLNAVMGLTPPSKGHIYFKDQEITKMRTSLIVRRGITMSPEGSEVFEGMSIRENLLMGAYTPAPRKKRAELMDKVYQLFPVLKEKEKQLATFLSGGQRQMLAIARAIMSDPELIICDEISLGLAPEVIGDIYEKLHEINKAGMTVVLVDQEVHRSLEHSHYSYVMVKGGVVMEGPSGELPEDEVKDAYFGINKYA